MLDAKRTFDALIARLAPDERAREEVLSNRIYQEISARRRRHPGVQRDRQALRAAPRGALRHDRARHAARAQRPGLPRRADAHDALPGGPLAADVPRARQPRRTPRGTRQRAGALDVLALHRRGPDRRSLELLRRARRHARRLSRARPRRRGAAARPRHRLPAGHLPRARAGARGALLRRAARAPRGWHAPR